VIKFVFGQNQDHGGRNGKCNTNQYFMGITSGRSAGCIYRVKSGCASVNSLSMAEGHPAMGDPGFLEALPERQERATTAENARTHCPAGAGHPPAAS